MEEKFGEIPWWKLEVAISGYIGKKRYGAVLSADLRSPTSEIADLFWQFIDGYKEQLEKVKTEELKAE